MNPNEIGNLMRRVDVAILLVLGFLYEEIRKLLGVSKARITNVQKILDRKGEGYRLAIKRILEQRKKRKMKEIIQKRKILRRYQKPDIELLKRKYPLYFLFWNIIDELGDYFVAKSKIGPEKEESRKFYLNRKSNKKRKQIGRPVYRSV